MLKRFCDRFCGAVDRVNEWVGAFLGLTVIVVTGAVIYEVVARSAFGKPTLWSNETTIYLSAMTYLVAGGYALRHRRHVRIDLIYERRSAKTRARLDLITFVFFLGYAGTLLWVGADMAWQSFLQRETTATPWDPPIWPVKAAIPLAGLLLLLQGIANLLRDLGLAPRTETQ
jgi:TRAP-type mannitol/chloroaromatic compound transport system permease small subunit